MRVTIGNDLQRAKHCVEAVRIASKLICYNGGTFECKSENFILTLFDVSMRPKLENCVPFSSPWHRKDTVRLEGIQRRAAKMTPRLPNKPYEERLKGLVSLTCRGEVRKLFKMFCFS